MGSLSHIQSNLEPLDIYPFGKFPSDHHAIWIDITCHNNAFGANMRETVRPQARRLKSNDPKVRRRFNDEYKKNLTAHRLEERIYHLQTNAQLPLTQEQATELDEIFDLRQKGLAEVEHRCSPLQ